VAEDALTLIGREQRPFQHIDPEEIEEIRRQPNETRLSDTFPSDSAEKER
jgi:hypothetical protein